MKRSEMIQHIYDELLTKLDHYKFKQGSDVWAEFVANELLDMIEGFGMLPPPDYINPISIETGKGAVLEIDYQNDTMWEKDDD